MSDLNDPRVFLAAERTLLAWNRTSLALIAFGFVIERAGALIRMLAHAQGLNRDSQFVFWVGLAFIVLGVFAALASVVQYREVLRSLQPAEIPPDYRINLGVFVNLTVALLGLVLTTYLFAQGPGL